MKVGFVYILSNKIRTTNYIGVTNNIRRRMLEHRYGKGAKFSNNYNLHDLVYLEEIVGIHLAIEREKQLKNWHKEWKWNLVKTKNPELKDLAENWFTVEEIEEFRNGRS